MGRLDLSNPTSVSWTEVATSVDTAGQQIADHWHIFAHGFHWISFSASARNSYLLKLDTSFKRVALIPVVLNSPTPTNDMFLVAEPEGVAVANFLPGTGNRLYRFDVQGHSRGQVNIGGGGYIHGNGSSALPLPSGYLGLAAETLNPAVTGASRAIVFDSGWRPQCSSTLVDESGTNAVMPSGVRLPSGYLIVNLRIRSGVAPRGSGGTPGFGSDAGAIIRLVVAPDGSIKSRETIVADGGNRPHTSLIGDMLITSWDEETGSIKIRVDRVT
jgi:hypothetical protein